MRGSMAGRSAVADANRYVLAPITKKTKMHSPKGQELMDEMDSAVSANLFLHMLASPLRKCVVTQATLPRGEHTKLDA